MATEMKISGLKELIDGITQLPGRLTTRVLNGTALAGARSLRDNARRRAPIKEGALRKSIKAVKSRKSSDQQILAKCIATDPKAHLIEFGHRMVTHKPGLKEVGHVPAQPFMRPALDVDSSYAVTAMQDYAKQRLENEIGKLLNG